MSLVPDLGDVWRKTFEVRDTTGALADATAVTFTVALPDGTTTSPAAATRTGTGLYEVVYVPTMVGRHGVRVTSTGSNADAARDSFTVADPATYPIASLDELRAHMQWTVSSPTTAEERRRDALGAAMLDRATALAEDYCDKVFTRRTITGETHDGGTPSLLLRAGPVLSITDVSVDGAALTSGWVLERPGDVLHRDGIGTRWATGRQNVVVSYVAGMASPPPPVVEVVLRVVEHWWQASQQSSHPVFGGSGGGFDDSAPSTLSHVMPYFAAALLTRHQGSGI